MYFHRAASHAAQLGARETWQPIGPEPITEAQANYGGDLVGPLFHAAGRVTAIVADATTQGRIFVGTANGGLWMVTSAEGSNPAFTRISDSFPNPTEAIGAIALDPSSNPPTIYVGTGEGNGSIDSYYGRGLFYSTNLGVSWHELISARFEEHAFTKLVFVNSGGTDYLFAGVTQGVSANRDANFFLQGTLGNGGMWRIANPTGGSPIANQVDPSNGACTSLVFAGPCPADDIVALPNGQSGYNIFAGIDGRGLTGGGGVYLSTDNGTTWSPMLTSTSCGTGLTCPSSIGRISLAGSGSTIYAMIGDSGGVAYSGFYTSTNFGSSWTQGTVPSASFSSPHSVTIDGTASTDFSQSFYDQALAVSPSNSSTVFFGGVGIYENTSSGSGSWTFIGDQGIHSDQHAIAFDPFKSGDFWVGDDGGLFLWNGTAFTAENEGLNTAQLYGVSVSSAAVPPFPVLGGFQDNTAPEFTPATWAGPRLTSVTRASPRLRRPIRTTPPIPT